MTLPANWPFDVRRVPFFYGWVHRITASGPPGVPAAQFAADVEQMARSWSAL